MIPIKLPSPLRGLVFILSSLFIISCHSALKESKKITPTPKTQSTSSKKLSTQDTCLTKGATAYWKTTYCKQRSNVDDKKNKKFQICVQELEKKIKKMDDCHQRDFIKKKICQHLVDLNYLKEGVHTCFGNPIHDSEWGAP